MVPAPESVADLDLQNGPDACRLVAPAIEEFLVESELVPRPSK